MTDAMAWARMIVFVGRRLTSLRLENFNWDSLLVKRKIWNMNRSDNPPGQYFALDLLENLPSLKNLTLIHQRSIELDRCVRATHNRRYLTDWKLCGDKFVTLRFPKLESLFLAGGPGFNSVDKLLDWLGAHQNLKKVYLCGLRVDGIAAQFEILDAMKERGMEFDDVRLTHSSNVNLRDWEQQRWHNANLLKTDSWDPLGMMNSFNSPRNHTLYNALPVSRMYYDLEGDTSYLEGKQNLSEVGSDTPFDCRVTDEFPVGATPQLAAGDNMVVETWLDHVYNDDVAP
ncbi:MAG: hypothetical protein MMC23_000862 [Stictis urceolatum]|nr:hypothetical protein [Stictis urceolata]